jgi:hypothetical protein
VAGSRPRLIRKAGTAPPSHASTPGSAVDAVEGWNSVLTREDRSERRAEPACFAAGALVPSIGPCADSLARAWLTRLG